MAEQGARSVWSRLKEKPEGLGASVAFLIALSSSLNAKAWRSKHEEEEQRRHEAERMLSIERADRERLERALFDAVSGNWLFARARVRRALEEQGLGSAPVRGGKRSEEAFHLSSL